MNKIMKTQKQFEFDMKKEILNIADSHYAGYTDKNLNHQRNFLNKDQCYSKQNGQKV